MAASTPSRIGTSRREGRQGILARGRRRFPARQLLDRDHRLDRAPVRRLDLVEGAALGAAGDHQPGLRVGDQVPDLAPPVEESVRGLVASRTAVVLGPGLGTAEG